MSTVKQSQARMVCACTVRTASTSPRCGGVRVDAGLVEVLPYGAGGDPVVEPDELAVYSAVAPGGPRSDAPQRGGVPAAGSAWRLVAGRGGRAGGSNAAIS